MLPILSQRLFDWVEDITPFQRRGLYVGINCLILVLCYTVIVMPKSREFEAMRQERLALAQQVLVTEALSTRWETLMVDTRRLEAEVLQEEQRLGLAVAFEQVFHDISAAAQQFHVVVTLWEPRERVHDSSSPLRRLSVKLEIEGAYHQLALFVDHIRKLPKILTVQGLIMQVVSDSNGRLPVNASFELIAYEPGSISLKRSDPTAWPTATSGALTRVDSFHYIPGTQRDPFAPFSLPVTQGHEQVDGKQVPSRNLILLGVTSGTAGFRALLSTSDGHRQFVHVGSILEHDQGVVTEITNASIVVQTRKPLQDGPVQFVERIIGFAHMVTSP